jgi:hypothetical protein
MPGRAEATAPAQVLAFQFDTLSLRLGAGKPLRIKLGGPAAERLARGKGAPAKANPFFKWVYADGALAAARGRSGGLALWKRHADEPVVVEAA